MGNDLIKQFVKGESPGAKRFNEIVDAVNRNPGIAVGGRFDMSRGPGGTGLGLRALKLWMFKVAQSWASIDVTDDTTPVKFYTCNVVYVDPTTGLYADGQPDDIRVYDPAGNGRTLDVDEYLQAFTNPNTGRWEALVGGSPGTTTSSDCHHIGDLDILTVQVVPPDDSAYVMGVIDGCLALFPVGDCSTS